MALNVKKIIWEGVTDIGCRIESEEWSQGSYTF